jgi:hypothetical protein
MRRQGRYRQELREEASGWCSSTRASTATRSTNAIPTGNTRWSDSPCGDGIRPRLRIAGSTHLLVGGSFDELPDEAGAGVDEGDQVWAVAAPPEGLGRPR